MDKPGTPAPDDWAETMAGIAQRSQRLVQDFVSRNGASSTETMNLGMADAANIGTAFLELTTKMMANPQRLMDAQISLWRDYMNLWRSTTLKMWGQEAAPAIEP